MFLLSTLLIEDGMVYDEERDVHSSPNIARNVFDTLHRVVVAALGGVADVLGNVLDVLDVLTGVVARAVELTLFENC